MGNQVTTLGQIYPVEYYLIDYGNELTLDANLGSTRFMKVARVKHKDAGYCVAKVYAINDPSIPIEEHKLKFEYIRDSIYKSGELNSLPFLHCLINPKCVILLRQYIKYNLYDRLSTRPFLTLIEKRWIAYQLLRCVQSIHKQNIYHGDIKSENVLVTSFLWVTLADFAWYKPVVLPENNPSDFSYYFDTSRRHCCNMAPERFVEQINLGADQKTKSNNTSEVETNQLTSQMDLFSLGCVLAELFSEDTPNSSVFDLGQTLMFKKAQYDPTKFIEDGISEERVRRLILNLIDLDPNKRNSASYHLEQLVPSLFPAYFQTLYDYFAGLIPEGPDLKILSLEKDLDRLMNEIITEDEHGLLLPLLLVTSCLRLLKSTDAKLVGIKLCVKLVESSPTVMSEYILDRILPYIIQLLAKSESRVRALCVPSLNTLLKFVKQLQSSDTNVFIDYILPSLMPLAQDNSTIVRISLAANISELAETSHRLIDPEEASDIEFKQNLLRDAFGSMVSQLLVDPNNCVRRSVLNENISKLCVFFGAEKTDEVILSHIIAFLNDKSDFRLRVAFFEYIAHISSNLGLCHAPVIKPLMQKGLADSEETVIYKCLKAISHLTSSNLLTKEIVYELFQEAVPLLSFPNKWIRNAVINFILVLSKSDESFDFNRRILPAIKLHLYHDIHSLRDEVMLLDSLQTPLPRVVIDPILGGGSDIDEIFHTITKRKMARDKKRYRTISETDTQDYDALIDGPSMTKSDEQLFGNIDRFSEDRLIDSELVLRRIHKNKRSSSSKNIEPDINIKTQDAIVQSSNASDPRVVMSSAVNLNRSTRPKGILLAHLHEHKGAVNKLIVIPNTSHFVSCSNDATIKFWDCAGVSTRPQVLFRSKQTLVSPDAGPIKTIATCIGADTLLALSDNNNLHLIKLLSLSSRFRGLKSINFKTDLPEPQLITDLVSLSPFTYATCSTSSNLRGYDLRLPTNSDVWNLKMDGSDGLITCLDGNEYCIACGTSSSVISMFDLRFYIKATTMTYPLYQDKMRKRIRRILMCNDEIYCSVDGNNEVSAWDCESASRTKTMWASSAPCLSSTQTSHHSVLSMIVDNSKDTNSVITAGDDMKIRFWDLKHPHRSYLMSSPPLNNYNKLNNLKAGRKQSDSGTNQLYYQVKLVDGIQVVQETNKSPECTDVSNPGLRSPGPSTSNNDTNHSGYNLKTATNPNPSPMDSLSQSSGHHDSISCLTTIDQSSLLLSASRDGVIKIWR